MSLEASAEAKEHLIYDWYARNSFIDHFTHNFNIQEFSKMNFYELGDFTNKDANLKMDDRLICFERPGGLYINNERFNTLMKRIII